MAPALVALGLVSLLGQVALLRELLVAFYGSELIAILALGAWLLGTATGAVGSLPRWRRRPQATAASTAGPAAGAPEGPDTARLFLAAGVLLVAAALWARTARLALGGVRGGYLPFPAQLFALALALLPVGFACGLLFQRLARRAAAAGRTVAGAYALESAGALAGGALATLGLRAGASNFAVLLLAALLATLTARPRGTAARLWALALVVAAALAPGLDRLTTAWSHPGLLATRDTPYGRVTVTAWDEQVNVFVNDALAYETGGTAAEEFVTLAALQHAAPARILVLGGGATGLVAEALRHGPSRVTSVELDPRMQALVLSRLPAGLRAAFADPRVEAVADDPRRFLAADGRAWDLILVGAPEPTSGQANRFYTREFFAACAARLAPGGVLALRLPLAENYWTAPMVRRTASIRQALAASFPHTLALPGATALLLAGDAPLSRDPRLLEARAVARRLDNRLATPAYVEWLVTNERVDELDAALASARAVVNSDARPACYLDTLVLWLSKFYPAASRLAATTATGRAAPPWLRAAGLAALAVAWLLLRRPGQRLAVVGGAAGGVGLVVEALLLLAWQARRGALYQDLGLLLMLFMAGLSLGAAGSSRLPIGRAGRAVGGALLIALALGCLALGERLRAAPGPGPLETGAWLLGAGALTAAIFGHASRRAGAAAFAAGTLYAADLAGGCAGSLAAGLLLVPLAGLANTAWLLAGLALAAAFWEVPPRR